MPSPGTEVVIVGGGPAGLSAALVLGRCCRRVRLFDSGQYRNAVARQLHGYLTRDGMDTREFRRIARRELARYETVEVRDQLVVSAARTPYGFEVVAADGEQVACRKLLLATGLVDELPPVPGAAELFGRSLHSCPYCEAWETRGQPLAAYGRGDEKGGGLALALTTWSPDVVLCTDGPSGLSTGCRARLERRSVVIREDRIVRFEGDDGHLRILFQSEPPLERRALFAAVGLRPRSDLPRQLGCRFDGDVGVLVDTEECTSVEGIYVVGDASRDVLQAIVAAAEGSTAAVAIHRALLKEATIEQELRSARGRTRGAGRRRRARPRPGRRPGS